MTTKHASRTAMLIRRPAPEVFEAFVDPAITTNFWFTKGSARLAPGVEAKWEWEMYGVSADVRVIAFEPNERLVIEWQGPDGHPRTVAWTFEQQADASTFVTVVESGFVGDCESVLPQVADSTQGFSFLLAGLKAYLEHGIKLELVRDAHPGSGEEETS